MDLKWLIHILWIVTGIWLVYRFYVVVITYQAGWGEMFDFTTYPPFEKPLWA